MPPLKFVFLGIFSLVFAFFFVGWPRIYPKEYGITWSAPYAESLGIDSQEGLIATLDDLGVRRFRIPAYWTDIEKEKGVYDFRVLREQLDEIAKRDGKVILAVGARLPRYPECWVPDWVQRLDKDTRGDTQLAYVKETYNSFKDHPAVAAWQVENEVNFTLYTGCEGLTRILAKEEMRWMREQESKRANIRPIYTSESGEFSTWVSWAGEVDGIGVSVYRAVISPWFGTIHYFYVPPWSYTRKASLAKIFVPEIFVSEFQMEPWSLFPLPETKLEDQYKTLSHAQMKKNFLYAERMDVSAVDFWGAEWWYWMQEKQGRPEFWNTARVFFRKYNNNVK